MEHWLKMGSCTITIIICNPNSSQNKTYYQCETIQEGFSALIYSSIYFYDLKIISLEPVLNADYCRIYFILVLTSIKEEVAK